MRGQDLGFLKRQIAQHRRPGERNFGRRCAACLVQQAVLRPFDRAVDVAKDAALKRINHAGLVQTRGNLAVADYRNPELPFVALCAAAISAKI
jgi:hypothetical protein